MSIKTHAFYLAKTRKLCYSLQMIKKEIIHTSQAPAAIGPYSQAMKLDQLIFTSGQLGMNPSTGEFVSGGVKAEAVQALTNLKAVLEAAGSSLENVVKTTVFLANMDDFTVVNEVYASFFTANYPARSAVQVAKLPKGGLVEVEAIAHI